MSEKNGPTLKDLYSRFDVVYQEAGKAEQFLAYINELLTDNYLLPTPDKLVFTERSIKGMNAMLSDVHLDLSSTIARIWMRLQRLEELIKKRKTEFS